MILKSGRTDNGQSVSRSVSSQATASPGRCAWKFLGYFAVFIVLCVAIQAYTQAWDGDLSRKGDEPGHFVNSAMIRDYLLHGLGTNPVQFALDYYAHLPRVTIGQWPPLFHLVQGGVFLLTGVSFTAAIGFQAVVASTAAAITAMLVGKRLGGKPQGLFAGAIAGLAFLAVPDVLRQVDTVMLDTFHAVLILFAALSWAAYAGTGRTRWSALFGVSASAAILTNGSAYGLALLPVLYIALTGRVTLLANWRTWLSAVIVLIATVPWFAMTYGITADGWVYSWGLAYTELAAAGFVQAAWQGFGAIGVAAFLFGTVVSARRAWRGQPDEVALACAATAMALFLFHLAAPADIQSRYLIAIAPEIVVVAAVGLAASVSGARRPLAPAFVVVSGLILNAAMTFRLPPHSLGTMNQVACEIIASPSPAPLVLVASNSYGEGALIAAFAAFDPAHDHYVVRASKALAKSNFLGSDYQARFGTADEVQRWIEESHISWLVLDDSPASMEMLHDRQLASLTDTGEPGWRLVSEQQGPYGLVRVFRLAGAPADSAEIAAVLHQVAPVKVIGAASG